MTTKYWSEFSNLLEKVTELSFLAFMGCPDIQKLFKVVNKALGGIAIKKDEFFTKHILLDRDITTENLKNASELPLRLPF